MLEGRSEVFVFQFTISTKILNAFLEEICPWNSNQSVASKEVHVTYCVFTSIEYTSTKREQHPTPPHTKTHQHAGTLSGKPFSCWVGSIKEEMRIFTGPNPTIIQQHCITTESSELYVHFTEAITENLTILICPGRTFSEFYTLQAWAKLPISPPRMLP